MTFLTLYTDVLDRLGESGTDITTKVKRWINETYLSICARADFPFLETTTTFNEVKDTETVSISSISFKKIMNVIRTDPTTSLKNELTYLDPLDFDDKYKTNTTSGDPLYYTIWGTDIKLGPRPDEAGTASLSVKYYKIPTELSGDSDTPVIPSPFHHLLILGAYAIGLEETEDSGSVNRNKGEMEAGINRLIAYSCERQRSAAPSFAFPYKTYEV